MKTVPRANKRKEKLEKLILNYQLLASDLFQLECDLITEQLPCKRDIRLMYAESSAIKTVRYLLDECIKNLEEMKGEK